MQPDSRTDPSLLTASEAAAHLAAGSLSAEQLAQACLARTIRREPELRAWAWFEPESILAQARALDAARAAGQAAGPLFGIPVGVKDVILTRDMPAQHNSPLHVGSRSGIDAACVASLRAMGAVIYGKTVTTEFAATTRGGPTRNPLDLSCTPGGSSSGSAAAVADFHVPLALGTQTGGSTIRPASFCGVFAMKPTWGAISREGLKMLAHSLDTLGLFSRSLEDLDLLADLYRLEDREEPREFVLDEARIGVVAGSAWATASASTRHALAEAVDRLRSAGAQVFELALPAEFEDLPRHHRVIMLGEAASNFLDEALTAPDLLHREFHDMVGRASGVSSRDLLRAYDTAAACRRRFDEITSSLDAVLAPSAPGEAPNGLGSTGEASFNSVWTLLHVPVINMPFFVGANGLPVGVSLTSGRYTDRRLLRAARAVADWFEHDASWSLKRRQSEMAALA